MSKLIKLQVGLGKYRQGRAGGKKNFKPRELDTYKFCLSRSTYLVEILIRGLLAVGIMIEMVSDADGLVPFRSGMERIHGVKAGPEGDGMTFYVIPNQVASWLGTTPASPKEWVANAVRASGLPLAEQEALLRRHLLKVRLPADAPSVKSKAFHPRGMTELISVQALYAYIWNQLRWLKGNLSSADRVVKVERVNALKKHMGWTFKWDMSGNFVGPDGKALHNLTRLHDPMDPSSVAGQEAKPAETPLVDGAPEVETPQEEVFALPSVSPVASARQEVSVEEVALGAEREQLCDQIRAIDFRLIELKVEARLRLQAQSP